MPGSWRSQARSAEVKGGAGGLAGGLMAAGKADAAPRPARLFLPTCKSAKAFITAFRRGHGHRLSVFAARAARHFQPDAGDPVQIPRHLLPEAAFHNAPSHADGMTLILGHEVMGETLPCQRIGLRVTNPRLYCSGSGGYHEHNGTGQNHR